MGGPRLPVFTSLCVWVCVCVGGGGALSITISFQLPPPHRLASVDKLDPLCGWYV